MKIPEDYNITFNYRTISNQPKNLNVTADELQRKETLWKEQIINNYKDTLVPYNLEIQVLVSDDGEQILRVFYTEDAPLII